jgi:hypothetical protein
MTPPPILFVPKVENMDKMDPKLEFFMDPENPAPGCEYY